MTRPEGEGGYRLNGRKGKVSWCDLRSETESPGRIRYSKESDLRSRRGLPGSPEPGIQKIDKAEEDWI